MYYPYFPAGWPGRKMPMRPRAMGRLAIGLGALSACMCLGLGNIVFRMIMDPEITAQYYGSADSSGIYWGMLLVYSGLGVVAALTLAILLVETWLPYKQGAYLLVLCGCILTPLIWAVPFLRGVAVVMPIVGLNFLVFSIGRSSYSGQPGNRGAGLDIMFWTALAVAMLPAAVFEATWEGNKVLGALCLFVLAIMLAVLSLALAFVVHEGIRTAPSVPSGITVIGHHVPKETQKGAAFVPFLLLAVVLPIIFIPPLELAWSDADLEIAHKGGSAGTSLITITLTVVNHGARGSGGPVVVEVSNASGVLATKDLGPMKGLEIRKVDIEFPLKSPKSRSYYDFNITLLCNGKNVDAGTVHIYTSTGGCFTIPAMLPVILAGAALPPVLGKRKRRKGP